VIEQAVNLTVRRRTSTYFAWVFNTNLTVPVQGSSLPAKFWWSCGAYQQNLGCGLRNFT